MSARDTGLGSTEYSNPLIAAWRQLAPEGRAPSRTALLLLLAYAVGWCVSAAPIRGKSDLDLFFWPAAQTAATGHPLLIYTTLTGNGPFANGPLGLIPLVVVALVANGVHWANDVAIRTALANAIFVPVIVLMAAQAVAAIVAERGDIDWRLAAFAAFMATPAIWISVADFGHFEQPLEVWLVLLSVAFALRGRAGIAGVAMGLALLTRTTAILYVIPVVAVSLAGAQTRRRLTFLVVVAVTVLIGLTPFLVADGTGTLHSLIGYRGDLGVGGGSLWALSIGHRWSQVIASNDGYFTLVAVLLVTVIAAVWLRGRRAEWTTSAGALTAVACCFPMLAKTTYPYYFVEPFVFATIWWLARPGPVGTWRGIVPLILTLDALIGNVTATPNSPTTLVPFSVTSSASVLLIIVLVCRDLARAPREPALAIR